MQINGPVITQQRYSATHTSSHAYSTNNSCEIISDFWHGSFALVSILDCKGTHQKVPCFKQTKQIAVITNNEDTVQPWEFYFGQI